MTRINIKDLKVGDEVTVTVTGCISHVYPKVNYARLDFGTAAEYISISDQYLDDGIMTVDRPPKPLPTKNCVYVPGNNAEEPEGSFLYIHDEYNEDGPWTQYNGVAVVSGPVAEKAAKDAHESLGGLVPLVPKG